MLAKNRIQSSTLRLSLALASLCFLGQTLPARAADAEHLPTVSGSQERLALCREGKISFSYPESWKRMADEDKNNLVKLGGVTGNGIHGEVSVSRNDNEKMTAEALKRIVDAVYLSKLSRMRVINEKTVTFGKHRNLKGLLEDIAFEIEGMKIMQRYVFFDGPDGAYTVMFTSPAKDFNRAAATYNQILLSLATGPARSAPAAQPVSPLAFYRSDSLPVSIGYPNGWETEDEGNFDHPLKITGKNDQGQPAEINIHCGHMTPYNNLEQIADEIESKYFKSHKGYRRVNRSERSIGANSKLNGILQEGTFEYKGVPVKQLVAFFIHNGNAYAVSMISPGWKESEMRHLFHKVLATIKVN
ncbi:MAG: hypothetical protein AB7W16_17555 [Candidatus Obscuribacterales bacterium]